MLTRDSLRLFLACLAAAAAGCSGPSVELVETRESMSTEVRVRAVAPDDATARRAIEAAWKEMDECVALLDHRRAPSEAWLKGDKKALEDPAQRPSDVWRINQDAGKWATSVDLLVMTCLGAAKDVWTMTDGVFDPTVGPLVDLWREAADQDRLPTDDEVAKARALVGMDKIELLAATLQRPATGAFVPVGPDDQSQVVQTVGLQAGMRLDLGGIAKGYIAGRMAERMKQAGATAGLVAAAGDVCAFGERPANLVKDGGDRQWAVGVQDPRFPVDVAKRDAGRLYTAIHIRDMAADTSGHYYRGYTIQGKRYSHILDPRTGRPVDNRIASVTVVADDAALSDAMATAIVVVGVKEGLALVAKTEGVECLILEAVLKEGQSMQPNGAPPAEAELLAHRSKGFAALEFKPRP